MDEDDWMKMDENAISTSFPFFLFGFRASACVSADYQFEMENPPSMNLSPTNPPL